MNNRSTHAVLALMALLLLGAFPAGADIVVQCPGDKDNDGISDTAGIRCIHLASSDGMVQMANYDPATGKRKIQYTFGFSDVTNVLASLKPADRKDPAKVTAAIMDAGRLASHFPAPAIVVNENDHVYLNLSNVGFIKRPDLFDPHTVHWHGFPHTGSIFDGLPESAIAINPGATATYYYQPKDPGTYMYHCHAEATEHMQMGMLGNLYVRPKQNGQSLGSCRTGPCTKFVYNDGNGSTGYDVELDLQLSGFDPVFHDLHLAVQPLPFALMKDTQPLMNGRGYPDTVNPAALPAPEENGGKVSQDKSALITARVGDRILLRISNLNVTRPYTLMSLGIPMKVVGKDARILRGAAGQDLSYTANSLHLGSGETAEVILNTTGVAPGTYFLYAAELNYLSNTARDPRGISVNDVVEDFGGMMTEIRVTP